MYSYRFRDLQHLESLTLSEEQMPQPSRGEVLVRINCVSLNYRDIATTVAQYVNEASTGLVPTSDAAGEVVSVGEGVVRFQVGDRVISTFNPRWFGGPRPRYTISDHYGTARDGWLCEYKEVSEEALVPLPDGISYEEGATLPCAGATAWNALAGSAPIRAGQTVLTLGSGGVSTFAIQVAKALGARVIATTSSDRKVDALRRLGADHVLNYTRTREWGREVHEIASGGVHRVIEVGGPATINQSLHAVAYGGEVVLIGFLSSENPGIDYFHLKRSGALIRSVTVGDRTTLEELVRAVAVCSLKPVIDRVFAFDEALAAFEHLAARGHMGKIVINVSARS